MKVDKYTKVLLTVIAVNLSILTLKNLEIFPKAYANKPANTLKTPVNTNYGLVPLNEDGSITVRLSDYDKVNVNIVGIETDDEMEVNIDEIGGGFVRHGGPVPVVIK
ncbi:hypothetical protein AAG747_16070 [Rapidithrix thailandica]|uniref:Uncharacterized protein n=1 Tax=Rapidithrix thailandica TaxID=413964 RepID=A0AAW9SCC1_9BACT